MDEQDTYGRDYKSSPTGFRFNPPGKEVGRLSFDDGKLVFVGDAEESAKVFIDFCIKVLNEQIQEQLAAKDATIAKMRDGLQIAKTFCGTFTSEDCSDSVAIPIVDALAIPNDDIALQEVIKRAKREALLAAADEFDSEGGFEGYWAWDKLRRMAEEIK